MLLLAHPLHLIPGWRPYKPEYYHANRASTGAPMLKPCDTCGMPNLQFHAIRAFYILTISSVIFLPFSAAAESSPLSRCKHALDVAVTEAVTASAGVFANMRNAAGSAKFETARLVKNALATLESRRTQRDASKSTDEVIVLKSSPNKLLNDSEDSDFCAAAEKQTMLSPIRYQDRSFSEPRDLTAWISDLQQGSGADGKDLYRQCAKSCSPRITYTISNPPNAKLFATAEVICGPARDKDENMYKITYGIASPCLNG